MKKNKAKMDLTSLAYLALGLVVSGVVMAIGSQTVTSISSSFTTGGYAANASTQTLSGIATLAGQLPTIALIAALSVVIALLVASFSYFRQ